MGSEPGAPVALVTGSNRGSGLAIARGLLAAGYRVRSLNRTPLGDPDLGELPCDLADAGAVVAATGRVVEEEGGLDLCVANAVDRVFTPVAQMSAADWDRQVAVNLSSVFHLARTALPALRARRGLFVVMGSHAATHYFEGGAAYSATKAALKGLVETLLLEERPHGVRACLLSPGAIANFDDDTAPTKITTDSVGRFVADLVTRMPADLVVGEVEFRPARLPGAPVAGIDRLLHV
ncbi:SDR family NAD(P)-dependent oxidoreductase [Actinokineospora bangkokensis]|uniref:Short-chain dehydrogenase n=1 Tax=Actinokineospora bangkokensis TaxID=1193682 RepID=A0A1Q9LJP8_9PSEU|nr:SDR family NAD(P)-dependent oxidoreductase [Actinokineospora bangkokensis]OLR92240.1 short-chain dehydrogenase [Actinokineospora bangkokensis]